jgi:glutamate--cysteine ligase
MSAEVELASPSVGSKEDLVEFIERGISPKPDWRIGTEHEKFPFHLSDLSPLQYGGDDGIRALLQGLQRFGWEPVYEGENLIALKSNSAGSITLEPGGQFELSGAPLETLHQTCDEVHTHLAQVKEVASEIGVGFLGLGFSPNWRREQIHVMPKGRYDIMRAYMPKRGNLGLDMMLRSCTVQVNLDFDSETDMIEKFRVSLALQPIATALFANSPFTEGKPNGFRSFRSHIWTDTDPDRCGMLPFVFEDGMGFERWVDYLLDVPMYFVYRNGKYLDASGLSFRDYMDGKLSILPGQRPTMKDWEDHMTTAFPEVRLKQYLEMRGADGVPWAGLCALPALWVGLLYDGSAQSAAWDLVKDWSMEEMATLRDEVPRSGLETPFRGGNVLDVARQVVDIANEGLKSRGKAGNVTSDETEYLDALKRVVDCGQSPADELLALYHGKWDGRIEPVFEHFAY